jgi:hypothetical protein
MSKEARVVPIDPGIPQTRAVDPADDRDRKPMHSLLLTPSGFLISIASNINSYFFRSTFSTEHR